MSDVVVPINIYPLSHGVSPYPSLAFVFNYIMLNQNYKGCTLIQLQLTCKVKLIRFFHSPFCIFITAATLLV